MPGLEDRNDSDQTKLQPRVYTLTDIETDRMPGRWTSLKVDWQHGLADLEPPRIQSSRERYEFNKLRKRLRREVSNAIRDFDMNSENDRIMVCLSGGKDSYTMLDILMELQLRAPVRFDLTAVNLDQKQPDFPEHVLPNYLESLGIPHRILEVDTYRVVKDVISDGKTMCGLCSRLRRGILYGFAKENGFNKIALGHHREDIVETLFLNMFHGGTLKAMPPKLKSDDGANVVIRPLAYCRETDIEKYSNLRNFPIIPCNLCGSQTNLERVKIKAMLKEWQRLHPGRMETIFRSIQHVSPSQLADRNLFDFASLEADREDAPDFSRSGS